MLLEVIGYAIDVREAYMAGGVYGSAPFPLPVGTCRACGAGHAQCLCVLAAAQRHGYLLPAPMTHLGL